MAATKKRYIFFAKLIFSLSILAYILIEIVPFGDIIREVKKASWIWLVLSFSLHVFGILISAYRWQILTRAQGEKIPLWYLAKSYLVAGFFNNFLPTRFGGDVVRIWDGSRYSKSLIRSSAVVLVERLTGVIVLLSFAFIASLLRLDLAQAIPAIWAALIIGFCGLCLVGLFFTTAGKKLIQIIPSKPYLEYLKRKLLDFREALLQYKQHKRIFLQALFWALLLQVNVILHYYLAGKAFSLAIPLLDYFIFVPIILLILTAPVTIGGLGLRELLYIKVFEFYAIEQAAALSFTLIADFTFALLLGLLGAVIYVRRK